MKSINDNINLRLNTVSKSVLWNIIKENDSIFLNESNIKINLNIFVNKILKFATIFEVWNEDNLLGFLSAYFNNSDKKTAFINMLLVDQKYQKMQLGSILVEQVLKHSINLGFANLKLEIYKSNKKVIDFYKKFNFVIFEEKKHSFIMIKHLT